MRITVILTNVIKDIILNNFLLQFSKYYYKKKTTAIT